MKVKTCNSNEPNWRTVTVKSHIPEALEKLEELSHNLWWIWNEEGFELFRSLDKSLFSEVKHNPIVLLRRISYERLTELAADSSFIARMDAVYKLFKDYMKEKPNSKRPSVAYFVWNMDLTIY